MASYKERFEELFGPTPDYDPINIDSGTARRRALRIQESVPGIDAAGGGASPQPRLPFRGPPKAIEPEQGIGGNLIDLTKTGTALGAEALVGAGEYIARQAGGEPGTVRNEVAADLVGAGERTRGRLAAYRQSVYDMMPPDVIAQKGAEFLTLDPDKTIWKGSAGDVAEAVLYKFWESVPMMAGTIIPAAVMMRAGSPGAVAYLGASEAGLSVGFIQNEIADGITQMPEDELIKESERYAELIQTMDPESARTQLIEEAQGFTPAIGGALVGAISYGAGRYLEPVITKAGAGQAMGAARRFGRGAASEGLLQEGPQESIEQMMQNYAARVYDGDRSVIEGVPEAYVQGAVVGAPAGGGIAVLAGGGEQAPDDPATDPTGRDQPDAPSSFTDVFGNQTPPPGGYTGAPGPLVPDAQAGIDPAIAAAVSANIREDNLMDDMMENIESATPEARAQGNLPLEGGGAAPPPAGTEVAVIPQQVEGPPGTQAQLPLTRREPGTRAADLQLPGEQQPAVPQVEQPAVEGIAPTGAQGELFGTPQGVPDQPTAEPLADIQAQLEDMAIEETSREGVYLSAGNVARLQRDNLMDQLTGTFVPVENFDDKGGLLLAKDEEVARGALDMKEMGYPMQAILGQLTRSSFPTELTPEGPAQAGSLQELDQLVKPMGSAVVQVRDDAGRVLRETLAPTEDAAYALADQIGDQAVVLTSAQALKRREQAIASEQEGVAQAAESKRQGEAIREGLPIEERGTVTPFAGEGVRKPASRAAAGVMGAAAKQAGTEKQKAIGGFFPPSTLEFENTTLEKQYAQAFDKLVDNQLQQETVGTYPINRKADLKKEETKIFKALGKIRQVAKPRRTVERKLKVAKAIDRSTVETARRELSKKDQKIDTSQKDYLQGEFTEMTREEIDALDDSALSQAFADAAYWLAGQWRNIQLSPEWKIDNPNATDQEIAAELHKESGDPLALRGYQDHQPSRQGIHVQRKKLGGRGPVVVRGRKTDVDTGVLTRDTTKQDESRSDELKRKAANAVSRRKLQTAVRQSNKLIMRMENQRSTFGLQLAERDTDTGGLTDAASDLSVARAYFVALNQFANSLINSGIETLDNVKVMDTLDVRLRELNKLPPKQFATQVSTMARADEQAGLKTIAHPLVREQVTDPARRIKTIEKYRENLLRIIANRTRMENVWKKNAYYNNLVGPLMQKFSGSIATDGWASYRPNEAEMGYLEHAMHGWRTGDAHVRKNFYDPLKRFFVGVGMEFEQEKKKGAGGDLIIHEDKDGNYQWRSNFQVLEQQLKKTIGNETEGTFNRRDIRVDELNKQLSANIQQRESAATRADAVEDNRQATLIKDTNRAINAFLKIVNNGKSTIDKLVKAEQRFIARMKDLGVWEDTPSPAIGKIRVGTVRTYRKIGLPLLQKKISKQDARASMSKIKPYPMPKGLPQEALTRTQAEKELDLKMVVIDPVGNVAELEATASAVGDLIVDRNANVSMSQVLDTMLANLPQNHIYRVLASKLRALNITDVPVKMDYTGKLGTELGAFKNITDKFGNSRVILINNRQLVEERSQGNAIHAQVVHVLLHEMVHAATYRALRNNPGLKDTMLRLREEAMLAADLANLPYGLTEVTDKDGGLLADEFVAEAMSNPKFQEQLKNIILDGKSAWVRFLEFVRSALGFSDTAPISVMDIIVSVEGQLFADAGTNAAEELTLAMDGAVRPVVSNMIDTLNKTTGTLDRIWNKVTNAPLIAMTMEQIRDTYSKAFGGSTGPLRQYMKAFNQRNAMNTRLMEDAEKLTRRWTALDELNGEAGTGFSKLATDATMQEVAADQPLSAKANEHLTSTAQKARHKELHATFNALPTGYKKLYGDLQKYYRETLETETALMTQNALRGLLTKGKGAEMTKAQFEAKYTLDFLATLDTKDKFDTEFGEMFDKDMKDTLHQMANLRQLRRGSYFPLKRYGDFIVAAEREIERKIFTDNKEAYGYAAERRLDDATLVVGVRPDGDGGFTVTVTEKEFMTAESATKAAEMRKVLVEQYGDDNVTTVQKKHKKTADAVISSNQALGSILMKLEGNTAAQAAIKNFYLEALSDSSFRKHEMRRKNRRGVETDLQQRNFTVYAKQSAYYTSQLAYGHKLAEGLNEMQKFTDAHRDESEITAVRLGQIREELVKRDEMTSDPDAIMKLVKGSVEFTQFMMLTSPSYWMINASQPWMVTLPWLSSKYGLRQSLAAMKNAQGLIISPLVRATVDSKGGLEALRSKVKAESAFNVLDDVIMQIKKRDPANADAYVSMLEELKQNNVIDLSWIAELRDISEGSDTGMKQKVLDASRVMAHLTEVNNRILTAVATYDLALREARTKGDMSASSEHAYAVSQAQSAVSETQFNYSSQNKPRLFQPGGPLGKFGPAVFQFMQWPQHMYALMIKNFHQSVKGGTPKEKAEARRLLMGLFSTHLAAGGVLGAALQPVKWAFGLLMMAFGEDDDTLKNAVSGETFDRDVTSAFNALFGSEIGGVLTKGLPTAVGADLSQRMSLGTIYYLDFKSDNSESAIGSLVLGLGGASVNLAANMWRGANEFIDGNYIRGIERASPKILRDVIRTGRYWNEGLVNNAGDTVINGEGVGVRDLFLQSLGIQPYTVSQFYQGQQAIKDKERYYRDRKSDILKAFRTAAPGERAAILRDVAEFNRNNPAIAITRSSLVQSVTAKAKREARFRRYGANIDERAATQFAGEGTPYR